MTFQRDRASVELALINYNQKYKGGINQMASIKDEAMAFTPTQTKNISELPSVSIDFEIKDGEGTDKVGSVFKYKYIEVNGEEYRIPGVVLAQVKDILSENKNMKSFKVKRTGEGKTGTRYTVVPLS